MSRDAKWHAGWIRLLHASSADEKMRNLEAADMLEDLAKRVPRWISVEERLPEDDDHYLVWAHDNGAEEVALYYGDGEWLTDGLENITRVVTHWMPLPEPPDNEKEESHE